MRRLLLIVVAVISSCQSQPDHRKAYVDMDSLVSAQVAQLTAASVSLRKEASINNKTASSSVMLDSLGWANELEVFRQLDVINRPAYRNDYLVTDGQKDKNSNLLVKAYAATGKAPVALLQLYYLDNMSSLKKIRARYREENQLFSMERELEMDFDDHSGKPLITGFRVDGRQKMVLSDSVHYSIRSAIAF